MNIVDFPGQPSVGCLVSTGCPGSGTNSHESEAVLAATSVARGDAVSESSRQPPSQQLAFINTNIQVEAKLPETAQQCRPNMINCELAASKAAGQNGGGRLLGIDGRCFKNEQMALERTSRRIPAILSWDDIAM